VTKVNEAHEKAEREAAAAAIPVKAETPAGS